MPLFTLISSHLKTELILFTMISPSQALTNLIKSLAFFSTKGFGDSCSMCLLGLLQFHLGLSRPIFLGKISEFGSRECQCLLSIEVIQSPLALRV